MQLMEREVRGDLWRGSHSWRSSGRGLESTACVPAKDRITCHNSVLSLGTKFCNYCWTTVPPWQLTVPKSFLKAWLPGLNAVLRSCLEEVQSWWAEVNHTFPKATAGKSTRSRAGCRCRTHPGLTRLSGKELPWGQWKAVIRWSSRSLPPQSILRFCDFLPESWCDISHW